MTHKAGLEDREWCTAAAWGDLDGDGYPELYVCHYVDWSWDIHRICEGETKFIPRELCPPDGFQGTPHRLYRNNRDGTFTDVSKQAGLRQGSSESGKGLGVLIVDVNDDRKPDIYAVNDSVRNFLYVNGSSPGQLRFTEMGLVAGVAMGDRGKADGSMGVDAADYDGSGRPSLLVTTFVKELTALYQNECGNGKILFSYVTTPSGLAALGTTYVGFGTGFLDVDLDGWEDVVIVNGHVRRFPVTGGLKQMPFLLRNDGHKRFVDITVNGGNYFQVAHRGRGLAFGDLDNDGRQDLVISHLNEPVVLLRNAPRGVDIPPHHWLGLELFGKNHRDIAGAKVVVDVGGRRLTRFAKGGGGYLSSSDKRLLFGLAKADHIDGITVFWPWGQEEHWNGMAIDQYWQLHEGERREARGEGQGARGEKPGRGAKGEGREARGEGRGARGEG